MMRRMPPSRFFCSERARRSSGYGPKRPGLQEICDVRFKHLEKQTIFA
jgi:hypothetical protein